MSRFYSTFTKRSLSFSLWSGKLKAFYIHLRILDIGTSNWKDSSLIELYEASI